MYSLSQLWHYHAWICPCQESRTYSSLIPLSPFTSYKIISKYHSKQPTFFRPFCHHPYPCLHLSLNWPPCIHSSSPPNCSPYDSQSESLKMQAQSYHPRLKPLQCHPTVHRIKSRLLNPALKVWSEPLPMIPTSFLLPFPLRQQPLWPSSSFSNASSSYFWISCSLCLEFSLLLCYPRPFTSHWANSLFILNESQKPQIKQKIKFWLPKHFSAYIIKTKIKWIR